MLPRRAPCRALSSSVSRVGRPIYHRPTPPALLSSSISSRTRPSLLLPPFFSSSFSTTAAMASQQSRLPRPAIFVCDIQEKFRKAINEFDKVVLTSRKVLRAAQILDIPVFVTTQNKARLGDTVSELKELLGTGPAAESAKARLVVDADKTLFSMWTPDVQAAFGTEFGQVGPASVVIVGIESHICVTQTALDLLALGHRVYILADGVSSCNSQEVPIALARLRAAGAVVTTSESWLYETLGDAGTPAFKAAVGLVKDTSADTKAALAALLSKM